MKRKKSTSQIDYGENRIHVINDTDKNIGPANADKSDVIKGCNRQLYDVDTYSKLSIAEMESFLCKCMEALRRTVGYHFYLLYHTFKSYGKFSKSSSQVFHCCGLLMDFYSRCNLIYWCTTKNCRY